MLRPFSRFCVMIGAIPESIIHSLSYEQQLLRLIKFLKQTVIPAIDGNTTAIQKIEEWIENVDLQKFVDTKLDEMVESGELQEIISEYLNSQAVFGFNTVASMKSATNLIDGSFARTYGKNSINDGLGEFYKIRTITSSDVVDEVNIIALEVSDTLIAERMRTSDTLINKKFILISDSYGTLTNENTKTWCEEFKNNLGLSDNQVIIKAIGGARFDESQVGSVTTFQELLEEVPDDSTVTDIIVCGGYNDNGVPSATILTSITDFKTYANTHFPNAKISIGFIGKTTTHDKIYPVAYALMQYIRCCKKLNLNYLNNVQYTLNDTATLLSSDGIHPNDNGQIYLGTNIAEAYLKGSCDNYEQYITFDLTANGTWVLGQTQGFYLTLNNGVAILGNRLQFSFNAPSGETINFGTGNSNVELAKVSDNTSVVGNSYGTINIPVNYLLRNDGTLYNGMGVVTIQNKSFKFRPLILTSNNYKTLDKVDWIQIQPYHHVVDSTMI